MPDILLYSLIFVASLALLVKSSDFFTEAAEKIGLFFGMKPFIVGVTIVAVGTSLPELVSSLIALYQGSSEIVVGNVLGSNVANIFLIIGVAALITYQGAVKEMVIEYDLLSVDLPLFVGSAFLFCLAIYDQQFSFIEACLFILGYLVYIAYTLENSDEDDDGESSDTPGEGDVDTNSETKTIGYALKQMAIVIASSIAIFIGANYTISSLTQLSEILNIGKEIIAVTAVALGTSLPELIVTINAASKGKAEVAIGNVLGSNIFNIFVVMGVPGLLGNLVIPDSVIIGGIPILLVGTLLMFFVTQDRKLTVWEGLMFFLFYLWFLAKTFNLA